MHEAPNIIELEGVKNSLLCDALENVNANTNDANVEDKIPDLVESDSEEDIEVPLIFIKI